MTTTPSQHELANHLLAQRFRGFYPVVIDVETGGLDAQQHALLELAAYTIDCSTTGELLIGEEVHFHIEPFSGAKIDPKSLKITGIDPYHPFRFAVSEHEALTKMFTFIKAKRKLAKCKRCVLVGHNAWFDLNFVIAAMQRCKLMKKNPFHAFTCFDTATLSGLIYGQTVLSLALKAANIEFDPKQGHSALYDARKTAELFCKIVNQWPWQYDPNVKVISGTIPNR